MSAKWSRRQLGKAAIAAGAASASCVATNNGDSRVEASPALPAPPAHARRLPTACDYCIVGCGYEAITWPVSDEPGTPSAQSWYSPAMHTIGQVGGVPHHVVVRPDPTAEVVNPGGDFSVRGGSLAQKLFHPDRDTRQRLLRPKLRLGDQLVDISWEDALTLAASLSRYVLDRHSEMAWGMKQYSYQYYENTYALTKLALGAVQTPVWATHDKPAETTDAPGLNDAGLNPFNASYADWRDSEVIYVSGVSLYDAKSILFQDWVVPGGAKLIVANPRRDLTASYALANGGMHLQVEPGTDTLLHNAIAREILVQGWEDQDFINARTVNAQELSEETGYRRARLGRTFEDYRDFILNNEAHQLDAAARVTTVPAEQIRQAAQLLAAPKAGGRPRSSFMMEKGNYWSHNVDNTNSLVSLGLLTGAGGSAGRVIARAGGHQRGMMKAASYPHHKSPDRFEDHALPLNVDRWVTEGRARMMWVVGTSWCSAMGASRHLTEVIRILTRETSPALDRSLIDAGGRLDVDAALSALKAKVDALGMVLIQQELYPNALTELADLVLPAAGWGEGDFTRMQGERRLRMYSQIVDPPGEAKPDWWIVAQVAQRMGYSGFDWTEPNQIFEEAAARSEGSSHDYTALIARARSLGISGHELLRQLGTTGVRCPIREEAGELTGPDRLHDERFGTSSGKAIFMQGSWDRVLPVQSQLQPQGDELWITNMRVNALWQSLADDARIPKRIAQYPANILEIHPEDAASRGIQTGDLLELRNDHVMTQQGLPHTARVRAVALVTDAIKRGVACTYFNYRADLSQSANCLTSGLVDPMNPVYRYKLAKARVIRVGESPFKERMLQIAPNII